MHTEHLFGLYWGRARRLDGPTDPTRRGAAGRSPAPTSAEALRDAARDAAHEQLFRAIRAAVEESRGIR